MKTRFAISLSLWNDSASADLLRNAFPRQEPDICWSVGDINLKTGLTRDRSYCHFQLGLVDADALLKLADVLPEASVLPARSKVALYIKNIGEPVDVVIETEVVLAVAALCGTIVVR